MSRQPVGLLPDRDRHAIGTTDRPYSAELEHTGQILARCAEILRHLAGAQDEDAREKIDDVADLMDVAADRLADLVREPARQ